MNEREQLAKDNGMTIEFVTWFFDNKKDDCGNVWFMMMAAMWEGWKVQESRCSWLAAERDALREGELGDARHSNTRAAADIYFQLVEECEIPAGGSLVEYVDNMRDELEAAEKELSACKSILEKIKSTSCHVDTSKGAFIPNSLDAWGRPVPQYLPYDFSGNPGASATQYCNGWNDAGGYWLNHVKYLQECITAAGIITKVGE